MKQQTLQNSFSLTGKGLHTGMDITITFLPAPENHGYKIQRIDLPEQPVIEAVADQVSETQRGTVVGKNEVVVSTIEHAMAALYGAGIDNCLIQVNAPEFPILDWYAPNIIPMQSKKPVSSSKKQKGIITLSKIKSRLKMKIPDHRY